MPCHFFNSLSQEYVAEPTPSHQNLIRIYWQTECNAGEYDVTACAPDTPPEDCVHTIRSNFTVRDMMPQDRNLDENWRKL